MDLSMTPRRPPDGVVIVELQKTRVAKSVFSIRSLVDVGEADFTSSSNDDERNNAVMAKRACEFNKYSRSSKYRMLRIINQHSSSGDDDDHSSSNTDNAGSENDENCQQNRAVPSHTYVNPVELNDALEMEMSDGEHNENDNDEDFDFVHDTTDVDTDGSEQSESDTESEENNLGNEEANDKPLFPGAAITVAQSLVAILAFTLRHKISGSCLSDLLTLLALHCPLPNQCCKSLYRFRKFFADIQSPITRHFYCSLCYEKLLSSRSRCNRCAVNPASVSYFLEISILSQLRMFYKRPNFYDKLQHRFTRKKKRSQNLEDIYDGEIYKNLSDTGFLSNPANISFTWNTDGVVLFKSSKFNVWPFYLVINELPYKQRVSRENLILAGIWFGEKKPDANLFMTPLSAPLKQLYEGLDMEVNDIEIPVRVRGILLCGTCDSPAKSLFLNMQQFNGTFGCPKCEIQTKRFENVQVYPYKVALASRTTKECIKNAREAVEKKEPVKGVKGPTVLSKICYDFINTTAIDVMHCIYLGITKKLMTLWFDDRYAGSAFSLRRFRDIVDCRIAVAPPAITQRIPRKISDFAYWKASELKIWLLYYSLSILSDLMEPEYLDHHELIVFAITTLNKESISAVMISNASRALNEYVPRFESLYGLRNMTSNIHLLLHLADVVKKFGPLWVTSCFPFEDANGMLKSLVHGSRHAQLQICSSVSVFINLAQLRSKFLPAESELENFCDILEKTSKRRRKTSQISEGLFIIGKVIKLISSTSLIDKALSNSNIIVREDINAFTRLLKNGMYYDSESYRRCRKYNSSYISFITDGVMGLGIIHTFVKLSNCDCNSVCTDCCDNAQFLAILTPLDGVNTFNGPIPETTIDSIYHCNRLSEDNVIAICVNQLQTVCFHTNINQQLHVVEPVNSVEFE